MISWTWPPGYGCETVGNTLIKHVCDLFWNPVDIGRRSGHFNKSSWINLGHARVLGNWMRAAQKRTTWRISQTKLSFSVPKWSGTFFWGGGHLVSPYLCLKWAACGDTGFICSFISSFMNSFFPSLIHPFSNRNICVAKSVCQQNIICEKLCVNKVGPYLSFGITQSLSVSGASSTALVPCGGMTSDVGPINATSNQGSTHAKKLFLLFNQSAEKLFPGDAWRD